jgi:hypothetical protein
MVHSIVSPVFNERMEGIMGLQIAQVRETLTCDQNPRVYKNIGIHCPLQLPPQLNILATVGGFTTILSPIKVRVPLRSCGAISIR